VLLRGCNATVTRCNQVHGEHNCVQVALASSSCKQTTVCMHAYVHFGSVQRMQVCKHVLQTCCTDGGFYTRLQCKLYGCKCMHAARNDVRM
jgi:hypothetical protein